MCVSCLAQLLDVLSNRTYPVAPKSIMHFFILELPFRGKYLFGHEHNTWELSGGFRYWCTFD